MDQDLKEVDIRAFSHKLANCIKRINEFTLPPTPNWSPNIFTLVQKVKLGHKQS